MNVFFQEFKWNLRSALIWAVSLGLIGLFFIYLYPSFSKDMEEVNQLFSQYPPEVLKALGLGSDGIGSFQGFYSFVLTYIILCGSIQALISGVTVIGKEGARKTSDFLFTKPLSRVRILVSKYFASMASILITGILYVGITWFGASAIVESFDQKIFFLLSLAVVLTQLLFTSLGFCIGCFIRRAKSPAFIGIGVGALAFGLQMTANLYDERALDFISPMSYLNPSYISQNKELDLPLAVCLAIVLVLSAVLGFWRYQTKDIHSA